MTQPKVIVCPFRGNDREIAALEHALHLAKRFQAHLSVWHSSPDPYTTLSAYNPYGIPAWSEYSFSELEAANDASRKAAQEKFRQFRDKAGFEEASFHSETGYLGGVLATHGRVADLIVLSRDTEDQTFLDTAHDVVFGSGRPVLLVPSGWTRSEKPGKALVAWNASVEATHAVNFSLPYLDRKENFVVTLPDGDIEDIAVPPGDLAHYLHLHGVEASVLGNCVRQGPLPAFILETARYEKVEMIVMGAYSHSRFRETILGGVTKWMLEHADIPVFMAH